MGYDLGISGTDRPGRYGSPDEEEDEHALIVKMANVEMYARRVRAGLPVFKKTKSSVAEA